MYLIGSVNKYVSFAFLGHGISNKEKSQHCALTRKKLLVPLI